MASLRTDSDVRHHLCSGSAAPGAAAVLINQTHTYTDLFLPIGSTEKRFFDAIDGKRNIAAIVEETLLLTGPSTNLDTARAFFERLWWHDQVVFDVSEQPG